MRAAGPARRVRRTRRLTTSDPWVLAAQDAVVMGRRENPYREGTSAHALYEEGYEHARGTLPADYAPEYPRRNRHRAKQ